MRRPLILVVEDEKHEQEIYGRMLWYNGFDVLFAATAREALALAHRHRPQLILLDLVLPDLDGATLCALLRHDMGTAGIPVITLSALPASRMEAEMRRQGCLRYLEKPLSPVDVLYAIEDVVGRAPPAAPQPDEKRGARMPAEPAGTT